MNTPRSRRRARLWFVLALALICAAFLPGRADALTVSKDCGTTVTLGGVLNCTFTASVVSSGFLNGIAEIILLPQFTDTVPAGTTFLGMTIPDITYLCGGNTVGAPAGSVITCTGVILSSIIFSAVPTTVTFTTSFQVLPTATGPLANTACIGPAVLGTPTCATSPAVSIVTSASFRGLSAQATKSGVLVRWRTADETDVLGFNVYRAVGAKRVRVNATLISARGRGTYSFLDRKAVRSARYYVQAVALDGARSWYGPGRVMLG